MFHIQSHHGEEIEIHLEKLNLKIDINLREKITNNAIKTN